MKTVKSNVFTLNFKFELKQDYRFEQQKLLMIMRAVLMQ